MTNGPSSSASTVSQKCRVSIGETSGRGGLRWPWLVSGLQLSLSAFGCLAGQRDGVVGEIQRRRTTPPCLGRRRGVAAARRLAQASGQLSEGRNPRRFRSRGRGPWVAVLGRPGGVGMGGRARSGFWVFGVGAAAAARGGPGDFFAYSLGVAAAEASSSSGATSCCWTTAVYYAPPGDGVSRARSSARAFCRVFSIPIVVGCAPPSTRRAIGSVSSSVVTASRRSGSSSVAPSSQSARA